jgi:hypothetical protein
LLDILLLYKIDKQIINRQYSGKLIENQDIPSSIGDSEELIDPPLYLTILMMLLIIGVQLLVGFLLGFSVMINVKSEQLTNEEMV